MKTNEHLHKLALKCELYTLPLKTLRKKIIVAIELAAGTWKVLDLTKAKFPPRNMKGVWLILDSILFFLYKGRF